MGGGEWPHASVFFPVTMYPVYKIWGEIYHKICCVKFAFCEAGGFNIKDKRSICKVFFFKCLFEAIVPIALKKIPR